MALFIFSIYNHIMPALYVSSIRVWSTASSESNVLHSQQPSPQTFGLDNKNISRTIFLSLFPPRSFFSTEEATLPRLSPTVSYPTLIFHLYLNIDFILPAAAPTVFPQLGEQPKGHPLNLGQAECTLSPPLIPTQTN